MPKLDVREHLEGDEVDLSLQSLTTNTVPVKDLAVLKKGKKLDLSKNQITVLPDNFISLTHLVKLDLSGNRLTELPNNIGALSLLQHLDLFNNEIAELPITIYQMKLLKWLDVKENPLNFPPNSVTGLCRNDAECKKCALQALDFLRKENSDRERMRQKELEEKRARKEIQRREQEKMEEEEERERKRLKTEEKAKRAAVRRQEFEEREKNKPIVATPSKSKRDQVIFSKGSKGAKGEPRTVLFWVSVVLLIAGLGLICLDPTVNVHIKSMAGNMKTVYNNSLKSLAPLATQAKDSLTPIATNIEQTLSPIVAQVDKYMTTHFPVVQQSVYSAKGSLSELLVVCQDTLYLGYDLANKEVQHLVKQLKMYTTK